MPTISSARPHQLSTKDAKAKVEAIAVELASAFDVDYQWKRNTLEFSRMGISGRIEVQAEQVSVEAQLSWLLMPIEGRVREEVERFLDREFGPQKRN